MSKIQIKNLSFQFDGQTNKMFDQFDLNIDQSWKLGLIGRNGRGKTTFMKLLMGKYPYQGSIQSSVKFQYFPQQITNPNKKTIEVLSDVSNVNQSEIWKIQIEIGKLKLSNDILERSFSKLSPGEQTKVLLAALFVEQTTFQLIDEPTNHLDIVGREVVSNYLKDKQGFIVVSHDQFFIDQVVDHVLSIDRNKIQLFNGNYSTWQQEFELQNNLEENQQAKIKTEIKRLTESAKKTGEWSDNSEKKKSKEAYQGQKNINLDKGFLGHKAAKMMKRSKTVLRKTESKIKDQQNLLKNIDEQAALSINYQLPYQNNLLTVNQLQVQQNEVALNRPISFDLLKGQRLALIGANGNGKTTLLRAILGEEQLIYSGNFSISKSIRISYLNQSFEGLVGSIESFAETYHIELSTLLKLLRKLGFEREMFANNLEDLSMGQKRKIALAKSLAEEANLYLWDEPLNYLDAITKQQIQDLILKAQPTMLIIDHDKQFIDSISTDAPIKIEKI